VALRISVLEEVTLHIEDAVYYLESTFIIFLVEDHLFRVPTYRFIQESTSFWTMNKLPSLSQLRSAELQKPNILKHVRHEDFRSLLKVLYPESISSKLSLSLLEWMSVLELSTRWKFSKPRALAIPKIESFLGIVEQIIMGRRLHISSWVLGGLIALVKRIQTITDAEGHSLDAGYATTAYRLFRIRENAASTSPDWKLKRVEEAFKEELDNIRTKEEEFRVEVEEERASDVNPTSDSDSSGSTALTSGSNPFSRYSKRRKISLGGW